jgi:hypothetical protein
MAAGGSKGKGYLYPYPNLSVNVGITPAELATVPHTCIGGPSSRPQS